LLLNVRNGTPTTGAAGRRDLGPQGLGDRGVDLALAREDRAADVEVLEQRVVLVGERLDVEVRRDDHESFWLRKPLRVPLKTPTA
jgi:hypothetical protein